MRATERALSVVAASSSIGMLFAAGCVSAEHLENFGSSLAPVYVLNETAQLPLGHRSVAEFTAFIRNTALPKYQADTEELCRSLRAHDESHLPLAKQRELLVELEAGTFNEQVQAWMGWLKNGTAGESPTYPNRNWQLEFGDPIEAAKRFVEAVSGKAVPQNLNVTIHADKASLLGRSDVLGYAMPGSNAIDMRGGTWTQEFFVFSHEFGHQASMAGESTGNPLFACLNSSASALEEGSSFAWELAAARWAGISNFDSPIMPSYSLLIQSVAYMQDPEPSIWAGPLHNHGAALLDAALTLKNGNLAESYALLAFDCRISPLVEERMQLNIAEFQSIKVEWEKAQQKIRKTLREK